MNITSNRELFLSQIIYIFFIHNIFAYPQAHLHFNYVVDLIVGVWKRVCFTIQWILKYSFCHLINTTTLCTKIMSLFGFILALHLKDISPKIAMQIQLLRVFISVLHMLYLSMNVLTSLYVINLFQLILLKHLVAHDNAFIV